MDVLSPTGSSEADSYLTIYMMDSRAYSQVEGVSGYDWIHLDQIEWYQSQAEEVASNVAPRSPPPAMAFFHIPIPEYEEAYEAGHVGSENEVCAS